MYRFIILLSLLTGCGGHNYGLVWSDDLKPFVDAHIKLGGVYDLSSLTIVLEVPDPNNRLIVGQCELWSDGRKVIRLDPDYWNSVGYYEKQALMHHELGHCIRSYEHRGTLDIRTSNFTSLMYPHTLPNGMYRGSVNKYNEELVNKEWK